MKFSLLFCLLALSLFACQQAPSKQATADTTTAEPTDNGDTQDDPDLLAITEVIHGFYTWYDAFQRDESRNISYINNTGKHLRLDLPKLEQFYSKLKAGGFIARPSSTRIIHLL